MMGSGVARGALITGASSGIGAAIARRLAGEGWALGLHGRDAGRLEAVASVCRATGAAVVETIQGDVRDAAGVARCVGGGAPLDLFVANAGILDGRRDGEALEGGPVARLVLETNLLAAIDTIHAALPRVRAARGRILIVSSLAAYAPLVDAPAYSASKAGLLSYGLAMREALRPEGIGVTVACPGYVETAMSLVHDGRRPDEIGADAAARLMLRAVLAGRATVGFPFALHQSARLSGLLPRWMVRQATRGLRFAVRSAR